MTKRKRRRKFKLPPPKRNTGAIHWIDSLPEASRKRKKAYYACGRQIRRFCYTRNADHLTCRPCIKKLNLVEAA